MDIVWTKGASVTEVALRLLVAVAIGALIGWDRERADKPAGLRTHMLVALGSASFTLLGFEVGDHLSPKTGQGFDPTRVLQGVIGGIGFLGAGAIIQNRGHVSGITTAASVWVAGALGSAAGVGAYVLAVFTAVVAFCVLRFVNPNAVRATAERRSAENDSASSDESDSESTRRPKAPSA
jgi:putative Mg2+ transporter-C (MgtC) family protein